MLTATSNLGDTLLVPCRILGSQRPLRLCGERVRFENGSGNRFITGGQATYVGGIGHPGEAG